MKRLDAHNYKRRIDLFFEKAEKAKVLPGIDIELLKKYRDYLVSEGITYGRVNKKV